MPQQFIDTLDDPLLFERIESFLGGVDTFSRSTLLPADVSQRMENILVIDNGNARTRPGADIIGDALGSAIQGLFYFDIPTAEQLIAGAGTKLYKRGSSGSWSEMTGYTLTDSSVKFSASQGVDKLLITDGVSPAIWDGTAFTIPGAGDQNPPIGATVVKWHAGRMWATGFDGTNTLAGYENDSIWFSRLLDFGANKWSKTDQAFRVGGGDGDPIVMIDSIQDTVMVVAKQRSIWILNTPPSPDVSGFSLAENNKAVSYGIGIVGSRAGCSNGNDWLFMSPDRTIRSLQRMQSASGQWQLSGTGPTSGGDLDDPALSRPIQSYMDRINWDSASIVVAKKYRELVLFSVPLDGATTNNAVLVYHGRLGRWIGVWTGWETQAIEVTRFGNSHALVLGEQSGAVRQWKDQSDVTADSTYLDDSNPIATKLWTRGFLYGDAVNTKSSYGFWLRFNCPNAMVDVTLNLDNSDARTYTGGQDTNVTLPVVLPFVLPGQAGFDRGVRGNKAATESYLKIESATGWWELRSITAAAWMNALRR